MFMGAFEVEICLIPTFQEKVGSHLKLAAKSLFPRYDFFFTIVILAYVFVGKRHNSCS